MTEKLIKLRDTLQKTIKVLKKTRAYLIRRAARRVLCDGPCVLCSPVVVPLCKWSGRVACTKE